MLWKIAVAGAESAVLFAAEELKRCLKEMDEGAEVAILRYPAYKAELKDVLWLGVCPEIAARVADPALDDSFLVEVENRRGAIRGSNGRSVLMGVYRFLRAAGCAWLRPGRDGELLPKRGMDDFSARLDETPSCRHRGICIEGAVSYEHVSEVIDWMPKLGYNAWFNQFMVPYTFYDRWYSHLENPVLDPAPLTRDEIIGIQNATVGELKRRGMLYHEAGHSWTCEPFGIPGETWDTRDYDVPPAAKKCLAQVNGKRELWHGIPLNTNLCYSNLSVRRKMVRAVADRCAEKPDIDFIQIWLADGTNNHCECPRCREKKPSDWYVLLLNEIDAELTRRKLPTRVVFLLYVDLLWEPETEKLANPDRFVLMFAPITRTYSASLADAGSFDETKLPPYVRNKLQFPASVEENLAWMRRWRKTFAGDGFDFDYHYMWDHFKDPGYTAIAKTLFRDMQALHTIGLNGMMSCQNQRVYFPTGLGMTAMAEGLWNEKARYEDVENAYFQKAFGPDWTAAQTYLHKITDAFDPVWMRNERASEDPARAEALEALQGVLKDFAPVIAKNLADASLPAAVRASWNYLRLHAEMTSLEAKAFAAKARGDGARGAKLLEEMISWTHQHEEELQHVLDVYEMGQTLRRVMQKVWP